MSKKADIIQWGITIEELRNDNILEEFEMGIPVEELNKIKESNRRIV